MNSPYDALAYSWWIDKDNQTIWSNGYGGQFLCIDKKNNLVILQRNYRKFIVTFWFVFIGQRTRQ